MFGDFYVKNYRMSASAADQNHTTYKIFQKNKNTQHKTTPLIKKSQRPKVLNPFLIPLRTQTR
jgi:hypothetical protein